MTASTATAEDVEYIDISLDFTCPQEDFVYSDAKFTVMMGGYGAGKTFGLDASVIGFCADNPGLDGALISVDYPRLHRDVLPTLYTMLEDSGIPYDPPKHMKPRIVLDPGHWDSTIWLVSMDNPALLKGASLAWAAGDEVAMWPRTMPGVPGETWDVVISRLRQKGGTHQFKGSTTPEGLDNWVTERFVTGPDDPQKREAFERDFRVIYADSRTNHHLPVGYVQSMLDSMDSVQAREKVEGRAAAKAGGMAYYAFDRTRNVGRVDYDRARGPIRVGLDFNVEPMAAALTQIDGGSCYVFDEIILDGSSSTWEMAKALYVKARLYGVNPIELILYPDVSGKKRTTIGLSDFEILRSKGLRQIRHDPTNPSQKDRLNTVNGHLHHGRIVIDSRRCPWLITDLSVVKTRPGTGEIDKRDPKRTHISDAFGYVLTWEMPIRRPSLGIVAKGKR